VAGRYFGVGDQAFKAITASGWWVKHIIKFWFGSNLFESN
jgi:hypothetical protein